MRAFFICRRRFTPQAGPAACGPQARPRPSFAGARPPLRGGSGRPGLGRKSAPAKLRVFSFS
ncbi:MAG: hypothetical protein DBY09_08485 [Selenomonadales bacterium]|nr:MAG: hypothetical protein DBY09_08485 [Selenomonadales bacterium]